MRGMLFGLGSIGSTILRASMEGTLDIFQVIAAYDENKGLATRLWKHYNQQFDLLGWPLEFTKMDEVEIVIEAASPKAVEEICIPSLTAGKVLVTLSTGAFVQHPQLLEEAFEASQRYGGRLLIPSGAIAGLDGVRAAKIAGIEKAVITTVKPPAGLEGAPFILEKQIDLDSYTEKTLIFQGSALEAVAAFPRNVNVAAAFSLAGIGPARTQVRVFVDPKDKRNSHEIMVESAAGEMKCRTINVPSPDNPKTSYLAILSALATVKRITQRITIGT
ncbi:MAG: aspartate dehydrogenase domain-containing protein [Candidatus Heimdallarchaeota archaeon]